MSKALFTLALKSTIDKILADYAQLQGINVIDLDDPVLSSELFKSHADAVVWRLMTVTPEPDPMYGVSFIVGARTVRDLSNYNLLSLVGGLSDTFDEGKSVPIYDYSGDTVSDRKGVMLVTQVIMDPQIEKDNSGVRFVQIDGKCIRAKTIS